MRESNGKGRESYPKIQIVYLHGSDEFRRICESLMTQWRGGGEGGRDREKETERRRRERERERAGRSCTPGCLSSVTWHQIFQISKREQYTDPHDLQPHLLWVPWDCSSSTVATTGNKPRSLYSCQ